METDQNRIESNETEVKVVAFRCTKALFERLQVYQEKMSADLGGGTVSLTLAIHHLLSYALDALALQGGDK